MVIKNITLTREEFDRLAALENLTPFFRMLLNAVTDKAFANPIGEVVEDKVKEIYYGGCGANNKIAAIKWVRDLVKDKADWDMKAYFISKGFDIDVFVALIDNGALIDNQPRGYIQLSTAKLYVEKIVGCV